MRRRHELQHGEHGLIVGDVDGETVGHASERQRGSTRKGSPERCEWNGKRRSIAEMRDTVDETRRR